LKLASYSYLFCNSNKTEFACLLRCINDRYVVRSKTISAMFAKAKRCVALFVFFFKLCNQRLKRQFCTLKTNVLVFKIRI
jgi:hypothetical protein